MVPSTLPMADIRVGAGQQLFPEPALDIRSRIRFVILTVTPIAGLSGQQAFSGCIPYGP